MPPHPARLALLQAMSVAALAMAAGAVPAAPAGAAASSALDRAAVGDEASLALARDRSARAEAAVENLKRALTPGHLTDPTPEADRSFGLEALRADYDEMQRKAAGYRATLGEQHPALVGTEQVLADLKRQILDGTRKALVAAEREAAEASAATGAIGRHRAARTEGAPRPADVTGSIAAATALPPAVARHPLAATIPTNLPKAAVPQPSVSLPEAGATEAEAPLPLGWLAGSTLAVTMLLLAAWAARPRRRRPASGSPARRVEPALAGAAPGADVPLPRPEPVTDAPAPRLHPVADAPQPRPDPVADAPASGGRAALHDPVPVLATLPLPPSSSLVAREAGDALAVAAADLYATLRSACARGPDARMTVLVARSHDLSGRDAGEAALIVALAAGAAGRRVALMEARPDGRLRRDVVPATVSPLLIEAGGAERTLYRLGAGSFGVAVLPSDAGEAEAAAEAARHPGTARLDGLDGFDLVVLVGENVPELAGAVDVVLIAAPAEATREALAAAARPCREAGRLCGALLVERQAVTPQPRSTPTVRRRIQSDPAQTTPTRLGLRGSIAPSHRHTGTRGLTR